MSRQGFAFIVVCIDIGSITVLLITLLVISFAQTKDYEDFQAKNLLVSNYTLLLRNLDIPHQDIYKELNDLLSHFEKILEIEDPNFKDSLKMSDYGYKPIFSNARDKIDLNFVENSIIYDINYSIMTDAKLDHILSYNEYDYTKKKLMLKKRNYMRTVLNYRKQDVIPKNGRVILEPSDSYSRGLEKQINKLDEKMLKCQIAIKDDDKFKIKIRDIYFTFRNLRVVHFFKKVYKKNCCTRGCLIFCCNYKRISHL